MNTLKITFPIHHVKRFFCFPEKLPTPHFSALAVEVLRRVIDNRQRGYVFVNPRTGTRYFSIHKSFDRAVRKLGLTVGDTKLRFQDLRHVFSTWLHQKGVSFDTLRHLLGHRDRATTDRYTYLDRLRAGKALTSIPRIERKRHKEVVG